MKPPLTESDLQAIRHNVKLVEGVAVALLFAIFFIVLVIGARPI